MNIGFRHKNNSSALQDGVRARIKGSVKYEMRVLPVFDTPILFIMWNRPQCVKRSFDVIRRVKPKRLFVASDGPIDGSKVSAELVNGCRRLVDEMVDWECLLMKRYMLVNHGCKNGVSNAIAWFFSNVEEGIIVEDDIVCSRDFFPFAEELLDRYRDSGRVGLISSNSYNAISNGESYSYTIHPHIWGWASWKRVWNEYDVSIKDLSISRDFWSFKNVLGIRFAAFWMHILSRVRRGRIDTWDYQLSYMIYKRGWLTVTPNRSLSQNIGFGEDSTHTKQETASLVAGEVNSLELPLSHPEYIGTNRERDLKTFFENYWPKKLGWAFQLKCIDGRK